MSQDPRDTIRKLQQVLQQRTRNGFGGGVGGMPGGAQARPLIGLVLLAVGGFVISKSIFNGSITEYARLIEQRWLMRE